jgi:hypothetical protein
MTIRSAIDLAENHQISELSKHIDIHHDLVRELVYDKTLSGNIYLDHYKLSRYVYQRIADRLTLQTLFNCFRI